MGRIFWVVLLVGVAVAVLRAFSIEEDNRRAKAEFDARAAQNAWKQCPKARFAADERLKALVKVLAFGARDPKAADAVHVLAVTKEASTVCGINALQSHMVWRDWNSDEIRRLRIDSPDLDVEAKTKVVKLRSGQLNDLISASWKAQRPAEAP